VLSVAGVDRHHAKPAKASPARILQWPWWATAAKASTFADVVAHSLGHRRERRNRRRRRTGAGTGITGAFNGGSASAVTGAMATGSTSVVFAAASAASAIAAWPSAVGWMAPLSRHRLLPARRLVLHLAPITASCARFDNIDAQLAKWINDAPIAA
jgi:hypothetical protein